METLILKEEGPIGILTINRENALNALNHEVLSELKTLLSEVTHLKAIILTGSGNKAFIAGADIKEMVNFTPLEMMHFCTLGHAVANLLENGPYITIAAVNGYALGGGLEMALACDFIYASESALLGLPEVTLGMIPGFGGTQRLLRAVGTRLAKEMIFSGKPIDAKEAHRIQLVNKVFPQNALLQEALLAAQGIVKHSSVAVKQAKYAINGGEAMALSDGLLLEKNMCAVTFQTEERKKGMEAFINRGKK